MTLVWNTKSGSQTIARIVDTARRFTPLVTVFAVNETRGRVGSATSVTGSGNACWDTARSLAEAAVLGRCDITSLSSELVVDWPANPLVSPALEGVAVRVLDNDGVCLGAVSLVGMDGYSLVRAALISQGFSVSDADDGD